MTIYIHPFVLGIIATLVAEVGICVIVGIVSSKKEAADKQTTQPTTTNESGNAPNEKSVSTPE